MEYIIDAKDKILGRIASEAALVLRGKKEANFTPNRVPDVKVKIINLAQIKIPEKKLKQKKYKRYSGYPGGLEIISFEKMMEKKGIEYVFKKAVMGMLPKNKLQKKIIKNLVISNE
ncbi:MAG: 50S ribosomal protein L13 [Candidatus Terrybacteria bacterium]|nr:50S ribosomal protein L13 [Candidatus Terrybacteria bacterium]